MNGESKIKCPNCNNKRIFDVVEVEDELKGIIKIKCPKCRTVVEINLNEIHTE